MDAWCNAIWRNLPKYAGVLIIIGAAASAPVSDPIARVVCTLLCHIQLLLLNLTSTCFFQIALRRT